MKGMKTIRFKAEDYELLEQRATKHKMTVQEYIEQRLFLFAIYADFNTSQEKAKDFKDIVDIVAHDVNSSRSLEEAKFKIAELQKLGELAQET